MYIKKNDLNNIKCPNCGKKVNFGIELMRTSDYKLYKNFFGECCSCYSRSSNIKLDSSTRNFDDLGITKEEFKNLIDDW